MASMNDFEDENGKVDWAAYNRAQIAEGKRCYRCESYIIWSKGHRTLCGSCESIGNEKGAVTHDHLIRCPKCRHTWDPHESDEYELFSEDCHETYCGECNHEFEITTHVSYSFTSPALEE